MALKAGDMRRFKQLSSYTPTSSPLPNVLRESLVAALADILVADYQVNQQDATGTVVEGSLFDRKIKGQE